MFTVPSACSSHYRLGKFWGFGEGSRGKLSWLVFIVYSTQPISSGKRTIEELLQSDCLVAMPMTELFSVLGRAKPTVGSAILGYVDLDCIRKLAEAGQYWHTPLI